MIAEVYPQCKDKRYCFAKCDGKCKILNHSGGEECPFCKPERDKISPYIIPVLVPISFHGRR